MEKYECVNCNAIYICVCVYFIISKTIVGISHPGSNQFSSLDLHYNLHFGGNSEFIHSIVGNLQIHLQQNVQEELCQKITGHNLCKNTNEWENKVLELPGLSKNATRTVQCESTLLSYCMYFSICIFIVFFSFWYTVTVKQVYLSDCNDQYCF